MDQTNIDHGQRTPGRVVHFVVGTDDEHPDGIAAVMAAIAQAVEFDLLIFRNTFCVRASFAVRWLSKRISSAASVTARHHRRHR